MYTQKTHIFDTAYTSFRLQRYNYTALCEVDRKCDVYAFFIHSKMYDIISQLISFFFSSFLFEALVYSVNSVSLCEL